jgi:hypothetical protein
MTDITYNILLQTIKWKEKGRKKEIATIDGR